MNDCELDALALEYKRDYGIARRDLNIADIMNNPNSEGVICVFGPGFSEKLTDLPFIKISTLPE
ncbi:MAG: hypothetical protein QW835_00385 [Candidatus Hadarchaeum sp.]